MVAGQQIFLKLRTKRVDILADKGDSCKRKIHMKALIFESQNTRLFTMKYKEKILENSASYSNIIKEKWRWRKTHSFR